MARTDVPIIAFDGPGDFEAWLEVNHTDQVGIWMKLAKAGKGITSITYAEAVELALCFGWIDGQKKGLDDTHWLQKFTPRRPRSIWSQINRDKATALIAAGRMRPAGLAEVERARADGRWELAYAGQASAQVPEEITNDPEAAAFFDTLDKVNRYAYVHRLHHAKRPETRAKLIEKLRQGHRLYER